MSTTSASATEFRRAARPDRWRGHDRICWVTPPAFKKPSYCAIRYRVEAAQPGSVRASSRMAERGFCRAGFSQPGQYLAGMMGEIQSGPEGRRRITHVGKLPAVLHGKECVHHGLEVVRVRQDDSLSAGLH